MKKIKYYDISYDGKKIIEVENGPMIARIDFEIKIMEMEGNHMAEIKKLKDEIEIMKMKLEACGYEEW